MARFRGAISGFAAGLGAGAGGGGVFSLGVCSWGNAGAANRKSKHPIQRIFRKYDGIFARDANTVSLPGSINNMAGETPVPRFSVISDQLQVIGCKWKYLEAN
jgi:hypothetical protein